MDKRYHIREGLATVETEQPSRTIRGYAVVFDELTDRVGYFKEKITRDALDGVDLSDVFLIVGHDFNNLLCRNGVNMRLEIDDTGLWFEANLPDTQLGRDTYELVRSGVLTGMSFGFTCEKSGIESDVVNDIDTITQISQLYEITLTPIPAYPQTVAFSMEKTAEERQKQRELQAKMQKKFKLLEVL